MGKVNGEKGLTLRRRKSSPEPQAETAETSEARLEKLGNVLRAKYDGVKTERIPDRLQRLIDALKEAEHKTSENEDT